MTARLVSAVHVALLAMYRAAPARRAAWPERRPLEDFAGVTVRGLLIGCELDAVPGATEETVREALLTLEARGLVRRLPTCGEDRWMVTNMYHVQGVGGNDMSTIPTAHLTAREYTTTLTSIGRAFETSRGAEDVPLVLSRSGARAVHSQAHRLYLGAVGWADRI